MDKIYDVLFSVNGVISSTRLVCKSETELHDFLKTFFGHNVELISFFEV